MDPDPGPEAQNHTDPTDPDLQLVDILYSRMKLINVKPKHQIV